MTFFQCVEDCAGERVALHVLELNPRKIRPAVSFQPEWNHSRGILRGLIENGELQEDHIDEEIAGGRIVPSPQRIAGAGAMRRQTWSIEQHRAACQAAHPDSQIIAMVGNGNLGANPRFIASAHGRLIHLHSEQHRFHTHRYSCLAAWDRRVSIEDFDLSQPLPPGLDGFTFGQRLVRNGEPAGTEQIVAMACAQEFYDLRHLFLFGRIPRGNQRWIDAGLAAFWNNGTLDTDTLSRAIRGEPVEAPVGQFPRDATVAALRAKDYLESPDPRRPGQFSLRGDVLRIVLREGIYPHNMIGMRSGGALISVVTGGLSNRAGLTIRGAALLMHSLGARDALLLDNGADVMMHFDGRQILGSPEGERTRLRSALFFLHSEPLDAADARLISYPRQPCRLPVY
ncbi:MAG: phosphodiester glycosidase family protein [Bryobacterales bacterium]|nr:phosphodiester glycosidase family protein [Bryobacterales bacterium]